MQLGFKLAAANRNKPVFMVDDEDLDVEAARRGLQKSSLTCELLSFPDGPPFIEYLEDIKADVERYPAIVLLDINMPLMSGLEVLRRLRADSAFADIPVVTMLTSSTHDRDQQQAREFGANDYLIKPTDFNDYAVFFNSLFE